MNRIIFMITVLVVSIALLVFLADRIDFNGGDTDQPLESWEPNTLDPVGAIDKAQEASDIQEQLDRTKQEQMDRLEDYNDLP